MKTTMKIAVIAMIGMSLRVSAQDETVNGKLTVNGNIDSGESLNLVNKGVRHSIFNYSGNSNFYFGAGKDSEGNKKEMIFYNYSCNGGCNVPRIRLLTDILYTPGKTGIGTDRPETKLHVKGNSQIEHSNGRSIRFDGYEGITTHGPSHWLHLNRYSNDNVSIGNNSKANVFLAYGGGNVGIGTISPSAKLDVNGSIKFDHLASGHTNIQIGHDVNDRIFADNSSNKHYGGGMFFRVTPDPSLNIQHNYIDVMMLTDNGKVGIGTKTMGNHKLAVEGSIGAREIKVESSGWSDFVFEKDYNLPTLFDVENHIKEKGHLKDIPSAKEVEQNGFFLGQMDAKLLQKIEELTLYTIEQEKKIEALEKEKAENKKQNSKIEKQQNEIDELKALVQQLLKDKN